MYPYHPNHLYLARKRLGLTMKEVATLLGHSDTSTLSRWENGDCLPSITAALKLEIICRQPVAFLFPQLYSFLRDQIRKEEGLAVPGAMRVREEATIHA